MTFNSFRKEARNDRVVKTMKLNSCREETWNDRDVETMTFKVSDKKPGMIRL
jgi:hypothetical protein